jgi:hypothetical protein
MCRTVLRNGVTLGSSSSLARMSASFTSTISLLYNAFEQNHALGRLCDSSGHSTTKLHLMRVGSGGSSSDVIVNQWKESHSNLKTFVPDTFPVILRQNRLQSGPKIEFNGFYLITNARKGTKIT